MPLAKYTTLKRIVHVSVRDGAALFFGSGRSHDAALKSAVASKVRQQTEQARVPRRPTPIPGWHPVNFTSVK